MTREGTKRKSMVIVGCGRLGSLLAGKLSFAGHNVVIIDRREEAFALLPPEFSGFCMTGDAVEHLILQSAKLDQADYLMTMTEKDTLNLMVALIGRVIFSVPKVIARIYDQHYEDLYHAYDIDTISPTKLAAGQFLRMLGED